MDPLTILAIAERLIVILPSAIGAFRKAASDAGADDKTLDELDAKYNARIVQEQQWAKAQAAVGLGVVGADGSLFVPTGLGGALAVNPTLSDTTPDDPCGQLLDDITELLLIQHRDTLRVIDALVGRLRRCEGREQRKPLGGATA